jgi:23S rRNA (cytosine1962-C5)-methyltransferase
LAGLPISARRGHKLPDYPRLQQRQFDRVVLDPPAWAKSAFGTVDLLRDYQSLLKPAILATAEDGVLICCNNLAKVALGDWRAQVLRCAEKLGRPVRECQVLAPAPDFPSVDGQPPLKTLILQF